MSSSERSCLARRPLMACGSRALLWWSLAMATCACLNLEASRMACGSCFRLAGRSTQYINLRLKTLKGIWRRCSLKTKGYAKKKSSTQGPFIWIRSRRPSPPAPPPSKKGNKSCVNFENQNLLELGQVSTFVAVFSQKSLYRHHFCDIHHHNTTHQWVSQPAPDRLSDT